MNNWDSTLLSQYANSPTLYALLGSVNSAIDPASDIAAIYRNLWNISTAVGQGLNNWGQVVGVSRSLQVPVTPTYFGFHEAYTAPTASTGPQPFGQATLYAGPLKTQTYTLGDNDYRTLILAKAAANITTLTAASLNSLLTRLFGASGRAYVQDTGLMRQRYVFEFNPSAVQLAIVKNASIMPRSAGVQASVLTYAPGATFGFYEAAGVPFGVGTFFPTSGLSNAS